MPYHRKKASGKIQGISAGETWQGAIKRNGEKPTIYPHVPVPGPIPGHSSKSDLLGKMHHCEKK